MHFVHLFIYYFTKKHTQSLSRTRTHTHTKPIKSHLHKIRQHYFRKWVLINHFNQISNNKEIDDDGWWWRKCKVGQRVGEVQRKKARFFRAQQFGFFLRYPFHRNVIEKIHLKHGKVHFFSHLLISIRSTLILLLMWWYFVVVIAIVSRYIHTRLSIPQSEPCIKEYSRKKIKCTGLIIVCLVWIGHVFFLFVRNAVHFHSLAHIRPVHLYTRM